jgi:hypothetical protein
MRIALTVLLSMSLLYPGGLPSHESSPQQNQKAKPSDQPPVPAPTPAAVKEPLAFGLEDGTPVKLRLNRTISSADAHVNDTVDFEVLEEVKVHDVVVVPRGSMAWGTVTEVEPKRRMGRGGKLNVNIDDVKLASGEKVPLRAVKEGKGGGHVGAMTGAMVATAIVFFPAAPLFLFMKGKDITIPKGTEITAYINGGVPLDASKFAPVGGLGASGQSSTTGSAKATATNPAFSSVEIKSTPDPAEITVDDKYRGSTPSTLRLAAGDHQIKLEKQGFKSWEKTLTVNSGENATVNASLEREANTGK